LDGVKTLEITLIFNGVPQTFSYTQERVSEGGGAGIKTFQQKRIFS